MSKTGITIDKNAGREEIDNSKKFLENEINFHRQNVTLNVI